MGFFSSRRSRHVVAVALLAGVLLVSAPATAHAARLRIPRIGLNVGTERYLNDGPRVYPGSAQPCEVGVSAIAGHHLTHTHPFLNLHKVRPGDSIFYGRCDYTVIGKRLVRPWNTGVLRWRGGTTLVLTSCWPDLHAKYRLVVFAEHFDPTLFRPPFLL